MYLKECLSTMRVGYKIKCSCNKLPSLKPPINGEHKFQNSGIYQLTCDYCGKKYTGRTGRNFETLRKEYLHSFRSNNTISKFFQHLLENGYTFGKIGVIIDIRHLASKCAHMKELRRIIN